MIQYIVLSTHIYYSIQYILPDQNFVLQREGGFPRILVGRECDPFCCRPLLGDTEVGPINCHETDVEDIPLFLTVKVDLWLRVWQGGRVVRMGMEKKM